MEAPVETTADRIRRLRIDAGLSQEQLAQRSGVTHVTVYRLERGLNAPNMKTARGVAHALGVSLEEIWN